MKACVQTCQLSTPVDDLDLCSHLSVHRSSPPTGIFSHHFIASYLPLVGRNFTHKNCN